MSTLKSSGYRSWSTKTFHPLSYQQQQNIETHERSHDQDQEQESRSHLHLRLNLVQNSKGQIELDLSKHRLHSIPFEIFSSSRLEVLKLSKNRLREVPLAISRLRSLKYLYLEENSLTFLPETINNCTNLVEINLTRNKLPSLPTNIGMLKNLKTLRLGQNEFECLPHEIGYLENLHNLDVHGNKLWYMPFSMAKLHRLKYLNLANNRFEHLPLPVCRITSLRILNLRSNRLMNLIPGFENLRHLKELNLAYNKLEVIPPSVFRLKLLMYLNLNGNRLTNLPPAIAALKSLQVLHVQANQIEHLPETMPNLQYLNIASNKLYNFSVASMNRLRSLNVNNNNLENLPMGFYSLSRLENLRLNGNQLQYISPEIETLGKLRTLDLGNNMLATIPHVIQKLDKLDYFNIKGNNIRDKISLHNGEIPAQTDFYKKRRVFEHKRKGHTSQSRHTTDRRSRKSSRYKSMSKSYTMPLVQSEGHKMWDSDDLLQNGFSERHVIANSNSAYLNRVVPIGNNLESTWNSVTWRNDPSQDDMTIVSDLDNLSISVASDVPMKTTDYRLLGICNQVEMLLNKQLLHPVLSLRGQEMAKSFSEKAIVKTASGLWRISDDKNADVPGLFTMTTETFTVTPQGGWLSLSSNRDISIYLPPKAVSTLCQAQMKVVNIEGDKMLALRRDNHMVSNIIAIGPIVYLKYLGDTDFDHQVTITIPTPKGDRRGHLHVLTIREDNSCVPSPSGVQYKNGYVVLKAWHLAGKAAVLTRAKCKYKACKSLEQLLTVLTSATHDPDNKRTT